MKRNRTRRQMRSDKRRQEIREAYRKLGIPEEKVFFENDASRFFNMYRGRAEDLKSLFRKGALKSVNPNTGAVLQGEALESHMNHLVREWNL